MRWLNSMGGCGRWCRCKSAKGEKGLDLCMLGSRTGPAESVSDFQRIAGAPPSEVVYVEHIRLWCCQTLAARISSIGRSPDASAAVYVQRGPGMRDKMMMLGSSEQRLNAENEQCSFIACATRRCFDPTCDLVMPYSTALPRATHIPVYGSEGRMQT